MTNQSLRPMRSRAGASDGRVRLRAPLPMASIAQLSCLGLVARKLLLGACVAVGAITTLSRDGSGRNTPPDRRGERWDGGCWCVVRIGVPASTRGKRLTLRGISGRSRKFCVAVGGVMRGRGQVGAVAER